MGYLVPHFSHLIVFCFLFFFGNLLFKMAPTCAEALSRVLKKKEAKVLYDKTRTLDELPSGVSGSALGSGVNVSHSKIYITRGIFISLCYIIYLFF